MKLLLDFQGAQTTGSRDRGIGRYTIALAKAMARACGEHDVWIALSEAFPETIAPLRAEFEALVPRGHVVSWSFPTPVAIKNPGSDGRRRNAELIRALFFASLKPDFVHVFSLFEGDIDDAVTTIGLTQACPPTSLTIHDLIPYVHADLYLTHPPTRSWYNEKLGHARRAKLWFPTSQSSRREAIDYLGIPAERTITVSGAASECFRERNYDAQTIAALRRRYNINKPFVMDTGGWDRRKNLVRLIRAYAGLPLPVRETHQLVIVCSILAGERADLELEARRSGLRPDELVLTGFVPEDDLVALYNLCEVFVFPSWHEGFGLPVLEAMCCGAPVIAANATSLPEIVGRSDALFDPMSEAAITSKIHEALADGAFRESLRRHGFTQSKLFTWENAAKTAWGGFEQACESRDRPLFAPPAKNIFRPRLAYVSPLPPEQTGIADYSAELLPELSRHYEIDVITDQAEISDAWIHANCRVHDVAWFQRNAHRFDRVLYQFGNSEFHSHMFELSEKFPGVVVLHDFFLSGVIAHLHHFGSKPGFWPRALYDSHGYRALAGLGGNVQPSSPIYEYPANLSVIAAANGVIVHSEYACRLAEEWYGEKAKARFVKIPHLRRPPLPSDRQRIRAALGFSPECFVVCSFGRIGRPKRTEDLIDAWNASPLGKDRNCRLVVVGDAGDEYAADVLRKLGDNTIVTGYVERGRYEEYLAAADLAVQLRALSRGESSGALLDCLAYGLPTIVNAHGSMEELPRDVVIMLPDRFANEELVHALACAQAAPEKTKPVGDRAQKFVAEELNPRRIADLYAGAIESFSGSPIAVLRTLERYVDASVGADGSRAFLSLCGSLARIENYHHCRPVQLFVDISMLSEETSCAAVVTRGTLKRLLLEPPPGYAVEPVYWRDGAYYYARKATGAFLGIDVAALADEIIDPGPGDMFVEVPTAPEAAKAAVSALTDGGVALISTLDLLTLADAARA